MNATASDDSGKAGQCGSDRQHISVAIRLLESRPVLNKKKYPLNSPTPPPSGRPLFSDFAIFFSALDGDGAYCPGPGVGLPHRFGNAFHRCKKYTRETRDFRLCSSCQLVIEDVRNRFPPEAPRRPPPGTRWMSSGIAPERKTSFTPPRPVGKLHPRHPLGE
ncbi:hypothetical protein ZHAS_00019381 [Anopheles sinensis]|uniref:Uncharacterized protein n=1 Tax=Anopheles sinensis TaxID=74873 RepID=A0A084WM83_ANOSI|nr:hypothetical protein ZHAS_00019381 [Anopheles sinensis]